MPLISQIVCTLGGFACLAVILHFILLALNKPEKFLVFINSLSGVKKAFYLGFLYVGWMTIVYCGLKGLLFQGRSLNDEGVGGIFMGALSVLAFISLYLIALVEDLIATSIAHKNELAVVTKKNKELLKVVKDVSRIEERIDEFHNKAKVSTSLDEKDLYEELHAIAQHLNDQICSVVQDSNQLPVAATNIDSTYKNIHVDHLYQKVKSLRTRGENAAILCAGFPFGEK